MWVRALALALVGLVCNLPFLGHISGTGGSLLRTSFLAFSLLSFLYAGVYFLLFAGRTAGRVILTLLTIVNAGCLYFIRAYGIMLDLTMLGNVFNTDWREASSFICTRSVLYVILLGLLPCVIIWWPHPDYGRFRRFALSACGGVLAGALLSLPCLLAGDWADRTGRVGFNLLLPWSYVSNSVRYVAEGSKRISIEKLLPYATFSAAEEKEVMVLVIGESSRWDHFSLYGYERNTTPLLEAEGKNLHWFKAVSSGTFTKMTVRNMLRYVSTDEYYELLPNYLHRNGVEVIWRSNNGGGPNLYIENYTRLEKHEYDGALLDGLAEAVKESGRNKVFVVLHTNSSHGQDYDRRYPPEFTKFSPTIETRPRSFDYNEALKNSYDNTITYTDHILHRVIDILKGLDGWRCGMMFVSDHGESLGENGRYMHGLPGPFAPPEQFRIPFIVWTSDDSVRTDGNVELTHFHVFHSVMDFLGMRSPIYDDSKNIFN